MRQHVPLSNYHLFITIQIKTKAVTAPGLPSQQKAPPPTLLVSQVTAIPASMLTVSALPSMDETVASTQQPLITPLKHKLEDEDDDYDS